MEPREIKALMMLKGITSASIAKKGKVTRTWVSLVLNNRRRSTRIRKLIAKAVGRPMHELWPAQKENVV